ncbi:MAG: TlpA disulfide reductase family protein [Verrucomicrobiia bacterium]
MQENLLTNRNLISRELVGRVAILLTSLLLSNLGFSAVPEGSWSISGKVIDMRITSAGLQASNTLSLTGHCSNGRFVIDLVPVKTQDEIAESAGWDGHDLFLIRRWPESKGLPRTKSLGYIEPTIFSRYATPALTSVLSAFADSNELSRLESGSDIVILDTWREYPEESNTFTVGYLPSGGIQVTARSPGLKIERTGMSPVQGFEHGFTRWTFTSNLKGPNALVTEYDRFDPQQRKLVQIRKVTSEMLLEKKDAGARSFLPEIPENSLTVFDYSQRQTLFQFYKEGLTDQNRIYEVTNHSWDFINESNMVATEFAYRKVHLTKHGIPKDLMDAPSGTAQPESTLSPSDFLTPSHLAAFDITAVGRGSTSFNFQEYRGRVVVLNVWATWCSPCMAELPNLGKLAAHYSADKDVTVICLSQESADTIFKNRGAQDSQAPIYSLSGHPLPDVYQTDAIPATFVIDKKGMIVAKYIGAADWSAPSVIAFIDSLR